MSVINDPLFLTTTGTIIVAIVGLVLRYCYKIKCDDIKLCCGLMTFHRNIDDEMKIDIQQPQNQPSNQQTNHLRRVSTGNQSQFNLFATRQSNSV